MELEAQTECSIRWTPFDVYADVWQPRLLADQIEFVTRNVGRRDHSVSVTA
jgi:hypothetical protein